MCGCSSTPFEECPPGGCATPESAAGDGPDYIASAPAASAPLVAAAAGTARRAKFILPIEALGRLLGLPDDVRVVDLVVPGDPARLLVIVEGDGLPENPVWANSPVSQEALAAIGHGEAPILWHPASGTTARVTWGSWRPGVEPRPGTVLKVVVSDGD